MKELNRLRSIRGSSSTLLRARGLMYAAALGASTLLTLPVSAADTTGNTESNASTPASGDLQLQEVVVTAEKRQESISKTPLSVSAVTPDALDRAGVTDVAGLSTAVPDLHISRGGQDTSISIRGIRGDNLTELGNPAVAFYADGIYVPRTSSITSELYDLDHVEVLRGPQGTLFGRNATAGAVSVITASPKRAFDAMADVAFGNDREMIARGMINVPVSDTWYLRMSAVRDVNDGYFNNFGTVPQNYYKVDQSAGRLTSLWLPLTQLSWQLSVDYLRDLGTPPLWVPVSPGDNYSVYDRPAAVAGRTDKDVTNVRSRIVWRFDDQWSITALGGYSRESSFNQYGFGDTLASLRYVLNFSSYSNELDLNYNSDVLKAVAGLYYFHEEPHGILAANNGTADADFYFPETNQGSRAAFTQATYTVTEGVRITGGLRYTEDRASLPYEPFYLCPPSSPISPTAPGCTYLTNVGNELDAGRWSKLTWKATVDFDLTPDTMMYATVSTGYKAGGLAGSGSPNFNPENITNYELGLKGHLLDGALSFSGDVFFMNYRDLQVTTVLFNPVTGITEAETVNAAKAKISGLELEGAWLITRDDRLDAYATYLDAHFVNFDHAVDAFGGDPACFASSPTQGCNLAGKKLPLSPPYSGRLSYSHTFHLSGGLQLLPQVSVYGQAKSYVRNFNLPTDVIAGYAELDSSLRLTSADGKWYAEAYGHNLTNKIVLNGYAVPVVNGGPMYGSYSPPRTYGVRLSYKY